MRKREKALNECRRPFRRNVDAILRNGLQRRVRWRRRVPIQLHVYAAGPLHHGILADRVIERRDQNIGAVDLRRADSILQIGHEIARTFHSERIRYGRFESEDRHASHGRQHELRHCLARSRSHREDSLLGRRPTESGHQAGHELVEVFRLDIHVSRVVLRADSKVGIPGRGERARESRTGRSQS